MPRYASTCQKTRVLIFTEDMPEHTGRFTGGIRCRYFSRGFRMDSHVYDKEGVLDEIERVRPDVILIDYAFIS